MRSGKTINWSILTTNTRFSESTACLYNRAGLGAFFADKTWGAGTQSAALHHIRIRLFWRCWGGTGPYGFIIIQHWWWRQWFWPTINDPLTSHPLVQFQASSWTWLGTLNDNVLTPTFSPPDLGVIPNNALRFFPWGAVINATTAVSHFIYQVASLLCPQWLWRLLQLSGQ